MKLIQGIQFDIRLFQEFLKKEFSEENLVFWIACEQYKKIGNLEQV